jgi:hypothetical protein
VVLSSAGSDNEGLPSWCPDWSNPSIDSNVGDGSLFMSAGFDSDAITASPKFSAGGGNIDDFPQMTNDCKIMKLYMTFRSCTKCSVTDYTDFYGFFTLLRITTNFGGALGES